jgi:hypothetical protein
LLWESEHAGLKAVPGVPKEEFTHHQDSETPAMYSLCFEIPRSKSQPHEDRDWTRWLLLVLSSFLTQSQ